MYLQLLVIRSSLLLLLLLAVFVNGLALSQNSLQSHFNGYTIEFKAIKHGVRPGQRQCRSSPTAPRFSLQYTWYAKFWARVGSHQNPVTQKGPVLAIDDSCAYVGWPGMNEVYQWSLESGKKNSRSDHESDVTWQFTSKAKKDGVETAMELPKDRPSYVRVIAIDKSGAYLGTTDPVELDQESAKIGVDLEKAYNDALPVLLFCVAVVCFAIIFAWIVDEIRQRRETERSSRIIFDKV